MGSATETEVSALYLNVTESVAITTCFEVMVHTKPTVSLKTDNSTAHGIINQTVKQKNQNS